MPVGATVAASTAIGAGLQVNAAGQATKAAKNANAANLAFTKGVYSDAQQNLNPTIQGGIRSGNALSGLLGVGGDPAASAKAWDDYRNSTNYNFQFDQGTQAVKTANAPSFINYGQGQAGSALAGYQSLLAGQQALGANSASALAGVGSTTAGQVANTNNNLAATQGSAAVYGANAIGSALQGLTGQIKTAQTASSYGGVPAGGWSGG